MMRFENIGTANTKSWLKEKSRKYLPVPIEMSLALITITAAYLSLVAEKGRIGVQDWRLDRKKGDTSQETDVGGSYNSSCESEVSLPDITGAGED